MPKSVPEVINKVKYLSVNFYTIQARWLSQHVGSMSSCAKCIVQFLTHCHPYNSCLLHQTLHRNIVKILQNFDISFFIVIQHYYVQQYENLTFLFSFRGDSSNNSGDLFDDGMKSLKRLLPLYDTGWGSLYDLRHFTTHVAPNRARWDYHTTHITQLLLLATIDTDPVISSTAQRWKDYMNGHRAKHN